MLDRLSQLRRSLRGRLLSLFTIVFLLLLVFVAVLVRNGVRESLIDQLADDLVEKAALVALTLPDDDPQAVVSRQAAALDARVTVIALDGRVLADSDSDPAAMDDHSDRPEVVSAIGGETGRSSRYSETTDEDRLYVALPPDGGRIVRLSVTEAKIADELSTLTGRIVSAVALVGAVGVLGALVVATRIARPIADLTDTADAVAGGDLDATPGRSATIELDRLGQAIGRMATDLGRRIRESEEERETLERVLGALPDGVLLVESDDRLSYANEPLRALFGSVPDQLRALTPASVQRAVRAAREGRVFEVDVEMGAPATVVSVVATPVDDGSARVLVVASDITERKRLEAMRRDFVADASHELKTPIASILASSEALQMALSRDTERAGMFASQVESAALRLAKIVSDLLDLSRLEASGATTEETRIDLVVAEEIERLRARAEAAGVTITSALDSATVSGPSSDWGLAVRNLCENAIAYTDAGGRVSVDLVVQNDYVELIVADTGAGIPTRSLYRVFERFYRVDVARSRATGGTGLGLALVKHVAERHGGSVSLMSELGVGSTFRVTLPRERPADSEDRPAAISP